MYTIKFDFLLLICLMSIWFLVQLEEPLQRTEILDPDSMFTSLLKDMIKDTDEELDEEVHRAISGRVPSPRAFDPVGLGCILLQELMCLPAWKFFKPHTFGILWMLPSCRHYQSWTPFSALFLSQRNGGNETENSKLLITAWSLWWPSLIQELFRSPPSHVIRTKHIPIPRKLQTF